MKKILLISMLIAFGLNCFSQDYLILRDGTEESVVVLEVTPEVVKYRLYGSNSRAIYSTYKSDIRKIIYEDGEEVVFNTNRGQRSQEYSNTTNRDNTSNRQRSQEYSNTTNRDNISNRQRNQGYSTTNRRDVGHGGYSAVDRRQSYDEYWDDSEPKFQIGIKGGANISTISGIEEMFYMMDEEITVESIFGFHIGVVGQYNFSNGLFIQPEILYSYQGFKGDGEAIRLGYIKIPVHLGYKIPTNNNFGVILGAGLYYAHGIHGNGEDLTFEFFDRVDFGMSFLGGVQFNKMQLTIGYDLGLNDIIGVTGWDTMRKLDKSIPKVSNRNLKISIAHFF